MFLAVTSPLIERYMQVCSYGYDYQLDRVLEGDNKDSKPSQLCPLFDYVGYCFCFVGYWTGPFYTYGTYNKMVSSVNCSIFSLYCALCP